MIVCHCKVVNDRAVAESMHQGARTLANVCNLTGAGKSCGACVFSLKRLMCEHGSVISSPLPEVDVAAS